jgi:uncharacterized membrane protein YdjX (TVP38/TMEM64 family)
MSGTSIRPMPAPAGQQASTRSPVPGTRRFRIGRLLPLAVILLITATIIATGCYRELSLENLVKHRSEIEAFIARNGVAAIAVFVAIYVAAVALSIPGAVFLSIAGGLLFGTIVGGLAILVGATAGATLIFLIARSAFGEFLRCRAAAVGDKLAQGFREDAFSYLLFLRLVPLFPFFVVNLVPALAGVGIVPFVAATAIGIIPATFAFAFFGAGLDSVLAAQEAAYQVCLAAGRTDCHLDFDPKAAATPQFLCAMATLGVLTLVPVVVKRLRRWRDRTVKSR